MPNPRGCCERLERVRRALRIADAAGAEDEAGAALVLARVDRRRRPAVVGRPGALAVEMDLVRTHGALVEIAQHDERIVVPLDAEGALTRTEDGNLARCIRLDPDGRLRAAGVAQKRPENETWHDPRDPTRFCRDSAGQSFREAQEHEKRSHHSSG